MTKRSHLPPTVYPFMQNREISWLRFNERVLEEAQAEEVPLLEKLKFISIFTSNLDEFFMIRVGSLQDLARVKKAPVDPKTGWSPSEQIEAIVSLIPEIYAKRDRLYQEVTDKLAASGIALVRYAELSAEERKAARAFYEREIQPLLSPQIIDLQHPFPFLENKKTYLFCELERQGEDLFGLVPIRQTFPKYFILPGVDFRYILVSDLVEAYSDEIFPGSTIRERYLLAITRNFDMSDSLDTKDEFEDYKEYMKIILKKRKRLSPVRLEVNRPLGPAASDYLLDKLELPASRVFISRAPLTLNYVFKLVQDVPSARREELSFPAFCAYNPLAEVKSVTRAIREKDRLLSYPYEEIQAFLKLLEEAASDPHCISIKITIYRLASDSKVVRHLVNAAERGIEVTVFMELKARFDEESNIHYSNILYEAGCQIIYGFHEFKIHSKLLLITYDNQQGELSYITQIGTGNYNESTAKQYTDFALLTADKSFGLDARDFFRNLAVGNLYGKYKNFLQAPTSFKQKIMSLIEREITRGEDGYVFCKFNSLTDKEVCDALVRLSQAGGRARLIIRGISCLLPGVPGYTDGIEIHSVVGRFLEHSRVYVFGRDEEDCYIASADLMTRNTERRVEIAVPIYDSEIRQRLIDYLETQWADDLKGRKMLPTGDYQEIGGELSSQDYFLEEAERAREEMTLRLAARIEEPEPPKTLTVWQRILRLLGRD